MSDFKKSSIFSSAWHCSRFPLAGRNRARDGDIDTLKHIAAASNVTLDDLV
jgi:hypothetical protein